MSLHFLGIKDFPVLNRQPSYPAIKFSDSPNSVQDLSQDSKDVLVQRLLDLADHLTTQETLRDEDVNALHANVDRMEQVIRSSPVTQQRQYFGIARSVSSIGSPRSHEEDTFWGPFSPVHQMSPKLPESPIRTTNSRLEQSIEMSPKQLTALTTEAEALFSQLSRTVNEFQARREETDHIHDLLVTRAESAAQRVLQLEERIKELETDFESHESELSFLRLQLRALEVQALQYMPKNADPELTQSINNWKLDWADLDKRTTARKNGSIVKPRDADFPMAA